VSGRARKAASASPEPSSGNERAEIDTMARRLEELRRTAGNSELRGAYAAAIDALDAALFRLAMLRRLEPPGPARRQASGAISPPSAPKAAARAGAATARIGAVRKPRR
jgi:hypothetical protein